MPSDTALGFLEGRRLKGIAVTGRELSGRFSQKEINEGLTKQRKKINPSVADPNADALESQSKLRKYFSKR